MRPILKELAAICLLTAASIACAAPIAYDEAVSGDLSPGGDVTAFDFDVGVNTLSGTMSFYSLADSDGVQQLHVDTDSFEFALQPGSAVTSAAITIEFTPLNDNTVSFEWSWYLHDLDTDTVISSCFDLLATLCAAPTPAGSLFGGFPLTSSRYIVTHGGGFGSIDQSLNGGGSLAYTTSFTVGQVGQVPEPETVVLMLSGLAAIVGRRFWRRTNKSIASADA